MLNKNQIEVRLRELGFKEESIGTIMADVIGVIFSQSLGQYFSQLPQSEQLKLKSLSESELADYIAKNKDTLPKLSAEDFVRFYNETWENYFDSIAKR